MDIAKLKSIGLTEGEANVYLALLKIGEATKTPISNESRISSSKVYEVLKRLIDKGLVSSIIKNGIKHFQAASPEKLRYYLELKEKEIKKEESIINDLIPQLNLFVQEKKKPFSTKLYEGFEGIKTAIWELLENATKENEFQGMGIISSKNKAFNTAWIHWEIARAKKGVSCRLIFSEKDKTYYYKQLEKIPKTKIRRITLFTPAAIAILGNKTLIFDYRENPLCIVIENDNISSSFKEFFESMWRIAKA